MTAQNKYLIFLFVFLLFPVLAGTALACTCTDYGVPVCKLYQDADAVFVGKVERITSAVGDRDLGVSLEGVNSISSMGGGLVFVHFKVEKGFKGIEGTTVKVLTYRGTSCDLQIKKGKRWVVYARKDEETGLLNFGACGGNGEIDKDSGVIKELEKLSRGTAAMSVVGRVALNQYDEVKDAQVFLEGNGTSLSTRTDNYGRFKFDVEQAGTYKIRVIVPFSAVLMRGLNSREIGESPTEPETVFEYEAEVKPNACDYEMLNTWKIDLKATAEINWRFSDDTGKTIYSADVQLCRVKPTEAETIYSCNYDDIKNPDGTYSFGYLREGDFVLVVNQDDFPKFNSPFLRHYYPGVRNFSDAQIIRLERYQKLTLPDFKLPGAMPTQEVKGKLFWKGGRPLTQDDLDEDGVYFRFSDPNNKRSSLSMSHYISPLERTDDGLSLDENGNFSFQAFVGATYIIRFTAHIKNGREYFKEIELKIDENLQPLEIFLEKSKE